MSVINTNVKSLIAQNAGTVNNRAMTKAMEQLSTGQRINSAADDAAGLAISSKMTSQIKGLNQAVRNANDGISMLQTAEGAMVEITNMMQRMRELAVQSANDTNTGDDRTYLNLEFQQLKQEANRITQNTQWNGMNVLDGSFVGNTTAGLFKFQVGANENQTIEHTINQMGFTAAGSTASVSSAISAGGVQTATLAITQSSSWKAGDVITLQLGNDQLQYTVRSTDIDATAGTGAAATAENIAVGIKAVFDSLSGTKFSGITATNIANGNADVDSGKLTFAAAANVTFATKVSAAGGNLATLDGLAITNSSTSNTAIDKLDDAIKNVNQARANIGAVINRLTYAADNLANVSMNTNASRSRILDTDYAAATTELARTQIISQAATAMLAQANQQPQNVLTLLR